MLHVMKLGFERVCVILKRFWLLLSPQSGSHGAPQRGLPARIELDGAYGNEISENFTTL